MYALTNPRFAHAAAAASAAWRWWVAELGEIVPARLRRDANRVPVAEIMLRQNAVEVEVITEGVARRFTDERPFDALDADAWSEFGNLISNCRARILLAHPDCYVTVVRLPKAARSKLHSAVRLQLQQISPLNPELIIWTCELDETGDADIAVRVAMAKAAHLERLREAFEAHDIPFPPVYAVGRDRALKLTEGHDGSRRRMGPGEKRAWMIGAALLASVPLTTLIGAKLLAASAQSSVAALQNEVVALVKEEREAQEAEDVRRTLRPLHSRPSVTRIVEELAARVPMTDHVTGVALRSDRKIEFSVKTADAEALEAALSESDILGELELSNMTPGADGRFVATYVGSAR